VIALVERTSGRTLLAMPPIRYTKAGGSDGKVLKLSRRHIKSSAREGVRRPAQRYSEEGRSRKDCPE
jgi:hypothetical protein